MIKPIVKPSILLIMNKEKNLLERIKNKNFKPIYNIPNNYFKNLNIDIENRINILESKKSKVILLNQLYKIAAFILFLVGFYFIFNNSSNKEVISYVQLNDSIDEYLAIENEIFYNFINVKHMNHLNLNKDIDDYLELELDF